jgi:hypothetical protein
VNQQARYAYQFYIDRGLAPHVAAGIVGNLAVESGNFDPNVISGTRRGDSGSAWYVQQLRGTRKTNFENWAKANKLDKTSLDAQLAFVLEEMNPRSPYKDRIAAANRSAILNAGSAEEAAASFMKHYERPNPDATINKSAQRVAVAQGLTGQQGYAMLPQEGPVPGGRPEMSPASAPTEVASLNPMLPGMDPDMPQRMIPVSKSMNPLYASREGASRMTSRDAVQQAQSVLDGPYEMARRQYKIATGNENLPPINDMIAKSGTSRERNTPNSQHFEGKAIDFGTRDLSDIEKIALNESLDIAGFQGRGYGTNILHADTRGYPAGWDYNNSTFAGRPVGDFVSLGGVRRVARRPDDERTPDARRADPAAAPHRRRKHSRGPAHADAAGHGPG